MPARAFASILVLALAGSAAAQEPSAPIDYRLANGLRVILEPVPGRRFVAVATSYAVGARDAPRGWSGLAHLSEHLMFSGTDSIEELELYRRLDAVGSIEHNAVTTADRTYYYEVLPASRLGWAFWLESQRMARTVAGLTEERVERQRAIVLHEGWERDLYGWRGLVQRALFEGLYPAGHPYRNVYEREADVRAIGLPQVQWFLQTYYAPDTATLAIVGGFDAERARREIERYFGPVRRSGPRADRPAPPIAPLDAEHVVELELQTERDLAVVAWPTPALYDEGDAELDVISTLLFERRESPLRQALIESGVALEASVAQLSTQIGSRFVIEAVPRPGVPPLRVVEAIDRAMASLPEFGEDEVARARERWLRRTRADADDLATRAVILSGATDRYLPTVEAELARYAAVDAAAVARTRTRWLPPRHRVVLIGIANPAAPPEGRVLRVSRSR
ncbi:MAG TPA: pitrilysin family protein [Sandaracinaceae bacterium]